MKKAKKLVVPLIALVFLASATAAFLGVRGLAFAAKLQLIPAALACSWAALAFALLVTLLFGRFFCRAMCPLGILQSVVNRVFHPKTAVRRVCTLLPETAAQRIVRWTALAAVVACVAAGLSAWAGMLDPYAIYGRALSLLPSLDGESGAAVPGAFAAVAACVFAVILVAAAIGKGRVWCNWICPAGTLFSLVSRLAWRKDAVANGCGNCRRCFAAKTNGAREPSETPDGVTRRDAIKTMAATAAVAAEKETDGGFADITLPGKPARSTSVLPPGAGRREDFFRKCISCQLCVKNCPTHCLAPSASLKNFGQPEMDFRRGACHPDCTRCSEVCPAGAISRLSKAEKRTAHIGRAAWKKELCLRATEDVSCNACERKCPVKAIHMVNGFPVVDAEACTGCGTCEHVCPARPEPAIAVDGLENQRWTAPADAVESAALAGPPTELDATLAKMASRRDLW